MQAGVFLAVLPASECTLREANATRAMLSAKGVRRSSDTNWLSCECVRLQKITCRSQQSDLVERQASEHDST